MNTYAAHWKGQLIEVTANTTYEAQTIATPLFQKGTRKKVKQYDVDVFLTAKDGVPYAQPTTF